MRGRSSRSPKLVVIRAHVLCVLTQDQSLLAPCSSSYLHSISLSRHVSFFYTFMPVVFQNYGSTPQPRATAPRVPTFLRIIFRKLTVGSIRSRRLFGRFRLHHRPLRTHTERRAATARDACYGAPFFLLITTPQRGSLRHDPPKKLI